MAFKNKLLCILLFIFFVTLLNAAIYQDNDYGFSIDFPEGFSVSAFDSKEKMSFSNSGVPVEAILRVYSKDLYANSTEVAKDVLSMLQGKGDISQVDWRNTDCVIISFSMSPGGTAYSGWGICAKLRDGNYLILLTYATQDKADSFGFFMASVIDSLCIDRGSFFECGPLTKFAYPYEGEKEIEVDIDSTKIKSKISVEANKANQFVVQREYAVLTLYPQNEMGYLARERFYQQVYRNAYGYLKNTSFDIFNALMNNKKKYENTENGKNLYLADSLLKWSQNMPYSRQEDTDFTDIISTLESVNSDCDSRVMLLTILLRQMNIDAVFYISDEYSHSVVGVNAEKQGAKIQEGDIWYVLGETTAKVDLGLIAADMNDTEKWKIIPLAY